jgi:hypothetical protein
MSEVAPLDAGFDLSIRGFGQASGGARTRRGNNRQGFVEQSSDEDHDSDGDFDSGDSDYTWLDVMTFLRIVVTLKIDAGA